MSAQRIAALVTKINNAPDFGYDDESVELNQLLRGEGKAWRWAGDFFTPHVEIYTLEPDDRCAEFEENGSCIHSDHTL